MGYAFRANENTEITSIIAASKSADLCNTNFNTYISTSFDRVYRQLSASLTLLVSWCSVAAIMTEGRLQAPQLRANLLFVSFTAVPLLPCKGTAGLYVTVRTRKHS